MQRVTRAAKWWGGGEGGRARVFLELVCSCTCVLACLHAACLNAGTMCDVHISHVSMNTSR